MNSRRVAGSFAVALALGGLVAAQDVTVPAGTRILVQTKAPIDAQRAGARFAAVLVDDVVVDFLGVAATGEVCAGAVVDGPGGTRTLVLTEVETPFGKRRIDAGAPRHGPAAPPAANVVGFAGSLPASAPNAAATAREGTPVVLDDRQPALAAGTTLAFELRAAWSVPLHEAESVFPQPAGAQPKPGPAPVPQAWFAQVDKAAARQQKQRADAERAAKASMSYARGWGSRGRGRRTAYGSAWPTPQPQPLQQMTPSQLQAMKRPAATLTAGTDVVARMSEAIDSSKVEPGAPFGAILMTDLVADGRVLFGRGSAAKGVITVGRLGETLAPTLALTWLQLGAGQQGIRTGAARILHVPAARAPASGLGIGAVADAPPAAPPADGALRLPGGTIVAFGLAEPVTVR